jgi:hypothetical protein
MSVKFSNNAKTTLSSGITSSATSITVADGSVFPSISGSEYFYLTLEVDSDADLREIAKCTARSGNTLTITRGQDGTSARTFSSGDKCELRLNAAALNDAVVGNNTTEMLLNQFTGDGSTTAFTLSNSPAENLTTVFISGVYQSKSNYSISGSSLTFSTAPPNGLPIEVMVAKSVEISINTLVDDIVTTSKIADDAVTSEKLSNALSTKIAGIEASADVTDTANVTAAGALMDSELTSEASVKALNQGVATTDSPTFSNMTLSGTDAILVPVGTTAQRPTGAAGQLRYNSTTAEFEGYTTAWGSIGGGIGDEYISATPTLSSSVVSQIVIGNYSSYVSPVFITKIGSTVIPHTNNAGTLTLSADRASFSGTQTVSVEAFDLGKLYSASATVSVELPSLTARYWRLTNQVAGGNGGPAIYGRWFLYSNTGGTGTQRGSQSSITASYNYSNYNVQNLFLNTTGIAWYLQGHSGTHESHWAQYDLGSAQEVLSIQWSNYHASTINYFASSFTIQNSNDGTNWTDIKDVTQTSGGSTLRTIDL